MATKLHTTLATCVLAFAAAGLIAAPAASAAESNHPKAAAVVKGKSKAPAKGNSKARKGAAAGAGAGALAANAAASDEDEPDIRNSVTTEYTCELGNKVTIYHNDNDSGHIALRWKKRLHRLHRVGTTTGALRFENTKYGLIWIGIPAKGLLLDSKQNRQLANECKNAQQAKPLVTAAAETSKG